MSHAAFSAPASPAHTARVAFWLVAGTAAYNVLEAALSLWQGASVGSIALLGFGLDSVIESVAAGALLWRLSLSARGQSEERIEQAERSAGRLIGVTFIALALYVVAQAGMSLLGHRTSQESPIGIAVAAASLLVMPLVAWAKLRTAKRLGSRALGAEAKETLACSYLSFTLLLGLGANALVGWWWADPAAALLMVPWLLKEGIEGLRGEDDDDDDSGAH